MSEADGAPQALNSARSGIPETPGPIEAGELELVRMTPEFMEFMIAGQGRDGLEFQGFRLWNDWKADTSPWFGVRLTQLRAMPELAPWLIYAIVRRADLQMVGLIGFHSAPGPAYLSEITSAGLEIGYSVFVPFRGRGYATHAASALIRWAHAEHGVNEFVASIARDNAASQRVAEKIGFKFLREFEPDDPDREDIYLLRRATDGT